MTYVISVPVKPIRLKLIGDLSWLANKYIQLLKLTNISEFCSHRKGGLCFQCSAAFSTIMAGEVNKQILVLSFRLSNISILGHSQPCLLRIFSIWSGYFWQTTVEVPDEEKKVFVGGLPHDCKHEDVKVLSLLEDIEYILPQIEKINMMWDSRLLFQEHFSKFGGVEKVKLMSDQVGFLQIFHQELGALYCPYRIC